MTAWIVQRGVEPLALGGIEVPRAGSPAVAAHLQRDEPRLPPEAEPLPVGRDGIVAAVEEFLDDDPRVLAFGFALTSAGLAVAAFGSRRGGQVPRPASRAVTADAARRTARVVAGRSTDASAG